MRKRVFVLVGAGVLVVGLFAGTVLAQDAEDSSGKTTLFGRVAEILGLAEDDVKDAFDQAKSEIRDERTDEKIDSLVESGKLSEEDAAELREWVESRPEVFEGFGGFGKRGFGFRRHGFGDGDGYSFKFEFRRGDGELRDFEGLFPNFDELRERIESFDGEGGLRSFERPRFRFFFGPGFDGDHDHEDDGTAEEDVPADATSL